MMSSDALPLRGHDIIRRTGMQHRRRDTILFKHSDFFFHALFK